MPAPRARRLCPSGTMSQAAKRACQPSRNRGCKGDRNRHRGASVTIRSRRGSTTSVSAPAGKVRRKSGERRRDLDGGDQSRARIEAGHQPGRTRVEHRQPDARERRRDQDDHESGIASRPEARFGARGVVRVDVQFGGQVIRPISGTRSGPEICVPALSGFGKRMLAAAAPTDVP